MGLFKKRKPKLDHDAMMDALEKVIGKKRGEKLNDNDIIELLAYLVGGMANHERRLQELEETNRRPWVEA